MQLLNETEFNKLTAAEKRVAIAEDVLARIEAKNIIAYSGDIFSAFMRNDMAEEKYSSSAKDFVNSNSCAVCAKGAILCSWVGNFNRVPLGAFANCNYDLRKEKYPAEILEIFPKIMLDTIEAYFEAQIFGYTDVAVRDELNGETYDSIASEYEHDLEGIMLNIIENKGEFIP